MFENIMKFFKKTNNKKEEINKDTAKERLHLVLMQDRANVSADFLDMMKQEIIDVIKKYIDVDEKEIDVKLTNKQNSDGTTGAPALYANIPIKSIKNVKPENKSLCSGQVLHCPYNYEQTKLIIKEMADLLVLEMISKEYETDMLVLTIEYDAENLQNPNYKKFCRGEIKEDRYGREVPKPAHGTFRLDKKTFSTRIISEGFVYLYDEIINRNLLIRKIYLTVGNLTDEKELKQENQYEQVNLFTNYGKLAEKEKEEKVKLEKEKKIQSTIIDLKNRFGKNAIIKGMDLEEDATTIQRNGQIGGHQE